MKIIFAVGLTLILGIGLALNAYAAGDATKGKAAYAVCAACHGANGMGNKALNAPRIAGQEPWYLERQLKNYKEGNPRCKSQRPLWHANAPHGFDFSQ